MPELNKVMKIFEFEDLEEGFKYSNALISAGHILTSINREECGNYLSICIPLPWKRYFKDWEFDRIIYERACFRFVWATDFVVPYMEFPKDRIRCFIAPYA